MLVPKGEEEEEPVIFDEEPDVDPKDVVKGEDNKPFAKAYDHINCKLATAPKAVQEEASNIKALPYRNGNQGKLQHLAAGWNHKLFKRIDELDMHKPHQKKANAYPKQVMVTKCGGA